MRHTKQAREPGSKVQHWGHSAWPNRGSYGQTEFQHGMEPASAPGAPGSACLAWSAECWIRPDSSARAPVRWPIKKAGDPGRTLSTSAGPR